MPNFWPSIPPDIQRWIRKQPLFFTASAPTHGKHVNVSPKGYPSRSFAIMSANQVAYLDGTGSGAETISHIYENGRVTVMFCSFTSFCRILRLFCTGRVIERNSPEFHPMVLKMKENGMRVEAPDPRLIKKLGDNTNNTDFELNFDAKKEGNGLVGCRAIIVLDVWQCQHTCGFGVPLLATNPSSGQLEENDDKEEEISSMNVSVGKTKERTDDVYAPSTKFDETWDDRNVLHQSASGWIGKALMRHHRTEFNTFSLDGVPGLETAMRDVMLNPTMVRFEHALKRVFFHEKQAVLAGVLVGLFIALLCHRVALRVL